MTCWILKMSKATQAARRLLNEFGLDDVINLDLTDLVYARGLLYRETPLVGCDGRIVISPKGNAIITINSETQYLPRKRFSIAHELGHFELNHRLIHYDNDATLDFYKNGNQEAEANDFAAELLIPGPMFNASVTGKIFSPKLLEELAIKFGTSVSSVLYRYIDEGPHPIAAVFSCKGKVLFMKKSAQYHRRFIDLTKLSVPHYSVAEEWFQEQTRYNENDIQDVDLNVWFDMSRFRESDDGTINTCHEYCFISESYNTVLSVIWED